MTGQQLGGSAQENADYVIDLAKRHNWRTVLDVGAGAGYYGGLLRETSLHMVAIDVWQPAVDALRECPQYHQAFKQDALEWLVGCARRDIDYDVVILGDVLEHMELDEAVAVFELACKVSHHVLVSFPRVPFPQDALYGNKHERHIIEDPKTDLLPLLGPWIECQEYEWTGTWLFSGNLERW